MLGDGLAELPELQQTGVRVRQAVALSRRTQLREQWVALLKEYEVRLRWCLRGHAILLRFAGAVDRLLRAPLAYFVVAPS